MTRPIIRVSYLVIIYPNSHENLTKYKNRLFKMTLLSSTKWHLIMCYNLQEKLTTSKITGPLFYESYEANYEAE